MVKYQNPQLLQLLIIATLYVAGIAGGQDPRGAVYIAPREEDRTSSPRHYDDEIRHPHRSRDVDNDEEEAPPRIGFYGDHEARETKTQKDNGDGFVEPLDFNSFLTQVGTDKKSANLPLFSSASNDAKDYFSGFFGSDGNAGGPLGLSSSASNQNSQKADDAGFVDPNVQFRSLFDSAETGTTGFRPQDFLGNKDDSYGSEPSKGSQTRTFPQFTYTGREDQDDEDLGDGEGDGDRKKQAGSKFRSSYRQVDGRNRDDDRGNRRGDRDPYDDGSYYDGEYDDSPPPPPNPRHQQTQNRYQHQPIYQTQPQRFSHRQGELSDDDGGDDRGNQRHHAPAPQESAQAPRAKASESKNNGKCKKIQKQVDYDADYASFVEPDPDYNPESYRSRYKRQANRNRQQGKKRPMTCYVCEDEQGRHAESCSYDSKADPSKGSYFTSSSSSYHDNGKQQPRGRGNNGRGGNERYRRNLATPKPQSTTTTSTTPAATTTTTIATAETRTDRNKRQDSYASTSRPSHPDFDYEDFSDFGFGDRRTTEPAEPVVSPSDRRTESNPYSGGPSSSPRSYGRPNPGPSSTSGPVRHQESFGPSDLAPRAGPDSHSRSSTDRSVPEFDFGQPSGFNSDERIPASDQNFEFSIPKEFDFETHTAHSNNRPSIHGSSDDDNFGLGDYSNGYEDYVKKYFPGAFSGSTEGPRSSSTTHSSREPHHYSPSSREPHNHYGTSTSHPPSHRGSSPAKEHTQQSNSFAYPPYEHEDNQHHLSKMLGAFSQKDRSGCQKVNKGDMTCYVCRDSRGMNKEECMYAAADPTGRNTRIAYEESTEYSSPQATVLLRPIKLNPSLNTHSDSHKSNNNSKK